MRSATRKYPWTRSLAAATLAAACTTSVGASAQTYVPSPESQLAAITSWWDSARGTQYVVYVSQYFSIEVLTCGSSGCWIVAAEDPVNGITPGGLDSSNPLLPFYGGSQLVSTYDGSNGHIYFVGWVLDPNTLQYENVGDLFEEHIDSNNNWSGQSLTAAARASTQPWNGNGNGLAPYLMSSLSSTYSQGRQHVFYAGGNDSRIHDSYFDGSWHDVPVTGSFTAPPFMGLDLTSYDDGLLHVYARGQEMYTSCDECGWSAGNAPPLSGYVFGENYRGIETLFGYGQTNYNYITENYFIRGWNASYDYGANYNGYSPILAYDDQSYPRVFYVGGNQHIYQDWEDEDITQTAGAPPAAMGSDDDALSPITGYFDGVNDHVFYVGVDQHVHELYMSSTVMVGQWSHNDLTLAANATQTYQLPNLP